MKIYKAIMNTLAILVTVLVIIFAGVFVVPRAFGIDPYVVESDSMVPVFATNDVVFIDRKEVNPQVGDIILVQKQSQDGVLKLNVTHRVVSVNEDGSYITKGDHNNANDLSPVLQGEIRGTYVYSIPKVGVFLRNQNQVGLVLIILVVVFNVAAWSVRRQDDKQEQENQEDSKQDVDSE